MVGGGINSVYGIRSGSVLNNREWKELERLKSKRNLNVHEKKRKEVLETKQNTEIDNYVAKNPNDKYQ